jgi:hypothetical protein
MSNSKIQVDTKDSGSQNFSFLAFKATSVASRQILSNNGGTARRVARERRKNFYRSNHVIYS